MTLRTTRPHTTYWWLCRFHSSRRCMNMLSFDLERRLRHEAFKPRSDASFVKGHGSVLRHESLDGLPFLWFSDALGIVPRMNDGTVCVGGRIKGGTAFHPDGRLKTGCRRLPFGGTTLLELLPAAARARIISSDCHFSFLWQNDLPQPQPPGSQAPTKPRSSESPPSHRKQKGRRLLAAGSGCAPDMGVN